MRQNLKEPFRKYFNELVYCKSFFICIFLLYVIPDSAVRKMLAELRSLIPMLDHVLFTLLVQAPMSECWEQMGVGMKVEVSCGAEGVTSDAYWVATVIGIAGQ